MHYILNNLHVGKNKVNGSDAGRATTKLFPHHLTSPACGGIISYTPWRSKKYGEFCHETIH